MSGAVPYQWIDTPDALAEASTVWSRAEAVAIDTEFVRERTFFAQLGLIQIGCELGTWLVDPLELDDLGPVSRLFDDPDVLKVAHSASEDLEVLYHRFGYFPTPLFDTQIGAGLAGLDPAMSYQKLVLELTGVELEKGETRSNWLRRPLSADQRRYAADDVTHLLEAHQQLADRLNELGRMDWALEDSARMGDPTRFLPDPDETYLRLGGIGKLRSRELEAAKRLAAWRERVARRRDIPRNFVVRERSLVEIARLLPSQLDELRSVEGLGDKTIGRRGREILAEVELARQTPKHELPPRPPRLPRDEAISSASNDLMDLVRHRAAELGLAPPALCSRREQKALMMAVWTGSDRPDLFRGWRWDVLHPDVGPILQRIADARPG